MMSCLMLLPWTLTACWREYGKLNIKNIFPIYQRNIQISITVSNKTNNPDNNTDAEEWKLGTSLIVGYSMIAVLKQAKLSRKRKVKVCKNERFLLLLFSPFAEEETE